MVASWNEPTDGAKRTGEARFNIHRPAPDLKLPEWGTVVQLVIRRPRDQSIRKPRSLVNLRGVQVSGRQIAW